VQHLIDGRDRGLVVESVGRIPTKPGLFESNRILAPALEARPVSRGKGRRLIKKEQLRPKARRHHHPLPSLERQQTGDPCLQPEGPHDLPVFIMQQAAVPQPVPPGLGPDEIAKGVDSVL